MITIETYNVWKVRAAFAMAGIFGTMNALWLAPEPLRHRIVDLVDYVLEAIPVEAPEQPQEAFSVPIGMVTPEVDANAAGGVAAPPETEAVDDQPSDGLLPPLDIDANDDPFMELQGVGTGSGGTDLARLEALPMLFTADEIAAIIDVECSGDFTLIGDNGKAYGPCQIWNDYLQDVNQRFGTGIKQSELLGNRPLSVAVMNAYMHRYAPSNSFEDRARIHNKGPSAATPGSKQFSKATVYWKKIQKAKQTIVAAK